MIADDISNWILTLPKWQQKLSYLIMEKKHISEEELNGIYDVFKTETKLQSGKISEDIEKVCNVNLENSPNVIWQGVGNLHGVNKLKSNSELNVSSGLTVIYGENGSGKSGYTRLLNNDYLKTFEQECQRLNADFNINIVSRGSSGQTLKKLQIKGNIPGKVLSEGEQRAISIANFLTEVSMDARNIGIVLDDPVCSLDHKRRSLIVKRLIEEAQIRQVVIFTHEITFFMELKTEAERNGVMFEQETIRKIYIQ